MALLFHIPAHFLIQSNVISFEKLPLEFVNNEIVFNRSPLALCISSFILLYVGIASSYRVISGLHTIPQIAVGMLLGGMNGGIWWLLCNYSPAAIILWLPAYLSSILSFFSTNFLPHKVTRWGSFSLNQITHHCLLTGTSKTILPIWQVSSLLFIGALTVGSVERKIVKIVKIMTSEKKEK